MKTIPADIRNREPFATTDGRPGQLLRGLEFDDRLLLFRAGDGGVREYDGYLESVARNFFHPGLRAARLILTEAAVPPGTSVPLLPPDYGAWMRSIGHRHPLPGVPRHLFAEPEALLWRRPVAVYDLSPEGENYLRLCRGPSGERCRGSEENLDIALLECLHHSAALPRPGLRETLRHRTLADRLEELGKLDAHSHRASCLRAAISEQAGELLEECYPLRRRAPTPRQERSQSGERAQARTRRPGHTETKRPRGREL